MIHAIFCSVEELAAKAKNMGVAGLRYETLGSVRIIDESYP
jgi:hypothetical protein